VAGLFVLAILPVVVGLIVGRLCGGRFRSILDARLRALWLLWLAAVVQVVQLVSELPLLAVVFGLVLVWLVVNVGGQPAAVRIGLGGVALGWAANGLAIVVNGGRMPYAPAAAAVVGLPTTGENPKNVQAGQGVEFGWLTDVIPVPVWPIDKVVSVGDLFIVVGVGVLVVAVMCGPVPNLRKEVM